MSTLHLWMLSREHRAEAASIESFFRPRSVAMVGVAAGRTPSGDRWCATSCSGTSPVVSTSSTRSVPAVSGMPAYESVADIPDQVDVAIVAVPAEAVPDVILDCAAKGVHGLVVISAGFAETGEEGRQRLATAGATLPGPTACG